MISLDADIKGDDDGVVIRGKFRERLNCVREVKIIGESEVNSGSRVMAKTSRSRGCNDVIAGIYSKVRSALPSEVFFSAAPLFIVSIKVTTENSRVIE
ncbi:hypothetical protein CEXT_58421 [Caerostris extrusa]|uniref:Uncharacterized protein n=1 Tax=Caerostris extrusa TaxID=172846 RepID=A0AAV4SUK2_CAEEX|nr:hypothetical protein CEXT_58421 [Caerostris extrusa]